ncbi:MAG: alternative oxidase [Candidatus Moraniibacteriota bacterium]
MDKARHEALLKTLETPEALTAYKESYDNYQVGLIPKILGTILVTCGNLVYGQDPSYGKFKAVEVIARIPYQSWEVASYTLLTMFYSNEQKAIDLSKVSRFSRISQDNETMHVVVLSQLAKKYGENGLIRHTLIPLLFSFGYAAASFVLYLFSPKSALQLNYLFEDHAFLQYSLFVEKYAEELKQKPVMIDFLEFYGRHVKSEYELFVSIKNDEIIHRNMSAHRADEL